MFGFHRLEVYRDAIDFLAVASKLSDGLGRSHGDLVDQFKRAAMSVPLNIAEGSGKFSRDASRFYQIARGSALECAAILDVLETLSLIEAAQLSSPREILKRLIGRLTRLMRS
jgi:four helix bundle protein